MISIESVPIADRSHPIRVAARHLLGNLANKLKVLEFPIGNHEPSVGNFTWVQEKGRPVTCERRYNTIICCCPKRCKVTYQNPFLGNGFYDSNETDDSENENKPKSFMLCRGKNSKFYLWDKKANLRSMALFEDDILNTLCQNFGAHITIKNVSKITINREGIPTFGIALSLVGEKSTFIPGFIWRLCGYRDDHMLRIGEVRPRPENEEATRFATPPNTFLTARFVDTTIGTLFGAASLYSAYLNQGWWRVATGVCAAASFIWACKTSQR